MRVFEFLARFIFGSKFTLRLYSAAVDNGDLLAGLISKFALTQLTQSANEKMLHFIQTNCNEVFIAIQIRSTISILDRMIYPFYI